MLNFQVILFSFSFFGLYSAKPMNNGYGGYEDYGNGGYGIYGGYWTYGGSQGDAADSSFGSGLYVPVENANEEPSEEEDERYDSRRNAFDLQKGKDELLEILEHIEENYLELTPEEYVSTGAVEDANNLDDLIREGNNCLTADQDTQLENLSWFKRRQLFSKLATFIKNFKKMLQDSANNDCQPPLIYLYTTLKKSF